MSYERKGQNAEYDEILFETATKVWERRDEILNPNEDTTNE
jgi:hypothetical protein